MEIHLLQFKLGHFLTFDEIQTFSMVAGPSKDYPDHVIESTKRILKTSFIYGANSSGKSNFVKGFMYSRKKVVRSDSDHYSYGIDELRDYSHIDSTGNRSKDPSYFEYIISVGTRIFSFGFEVDSRSGTMMSEWLVEIFDDGSEETMYAIDIDGDHSDNDLFSDLYREYAGTDRRCAFLNFIDASGYSDECSVIIKDLVSWFVYGLKVIPSSLIDCLVPVDRGFLKQLEVQLRALDVQSSPIQLSEEDGNKSSLKDHATDFFGGHLSKDGMLIEMPSIFNLIAKSESGIENTPLIFEHDKGGISLRYDQESEGTRKILMLLTMLMSRYDDVSNTVIVDEMESNLHTLVCKEIVNRMVRGNYSCDQLIVTTHETRLMDDARPDEIWMVDRSPNDDERASTLHSLEEYNHVEKKTLNSDYLIGIYGGIPWIKED